MVLILLVSLTLFISGCGGTVETSDIRTAPENGVSAADRIINKAGSGAVGYAAGYGTVSIEEDKASAKDTTITSDAAMLVCVDTAEVIYEKNVYKRVAPASITKILTALTAMDKIDLDAYYTLTDGITVDFPDAQLAGFQPGDTVRLRDLLSAMLVYSGNECANGIACASSGSVEKFVKDMNKKAVSIACSDTHFVNANGLDEKDHYTTVYDLYLIFSKCLENKDFVDIISSTYTSFGYTRADGSYGSMNLDTTNLYLKGWYYAPGDIEVIGGKTGTTENGGACLICLFEDGEGKRYIGISMGNDDKPALYEQMNTMLAMAAD